MKNIIALLFLFPLSLVAQQNGGEWHLGISGGPEVSAMTIQNVDESSTAKYGFTSGLTIAYNINPKLTWQSGISFGIKNINHTQSGLTFGSDIDPTTGFTGSSVLTRKIQLSDVEIPVQMKYFFFKQFYARTGVGINFLNEKSVEGKINHSDGTISELLIKSLDSYINYSATLGFGYMQPIGDKLNFNIEPFIKYYLRDNIIPITHLYNIGLNASLTLKL
ncbi:MAG: outer membrane beta-barrel protein [Crocinitomix sp.]|nr:outer membrane beta-barrel protein [Crocinitomix sp.]